MPCHICSMLLVGFCWMQRWKRRISMQKLVLLDMLILHPMFFCGWFSGIWGQLFFEEDGMQAKFLVGQKLCWGVGEDSCLIGFCDCTKWRTLGLEDGAAVDLNRSHLWSIIVTVVYFSVALFLCLCVSLLCIVCVVCHYVCNVLCVCVYVCVTVVFCCVRQSIIIQPSTK